MPATDNLIETTAAAIALQHGLEIEAARLIAQSAIAAVSEHHAIVSPNMTLDMSVAGNIARQQGGRVPLHRIWRAIFDARPRPTAEPAPAEPAVVEAQPAMACEHAPEPRRYYWPTESWSVPAANLCGAMGRRERQPTMCVKGRLHSGRHRYARLTAFRDRSHREFRS